MVFRWRFSAASIFSHAKERLEPLLNDAKPAILGNLSEINHFIDIHLKYTYNYVPSG